MLSQKQQRVQKWPWLRAGNEAEHTHCVKVFMMINYYMSFQVASLVKELKEM